MAKSSSERIGFGLQPTTAMLTSGRSTYWSRAYDSFREKPFSEPLPGKFKSIIESVDNGQYDLLPELALELERRDSHIAFLSESRRMGLSALDWEILPNAETDDDSAAEEAADYVKETLRAIPSFRQTVKHLLLAITSGIAATELVFENSELVETVDVPHTRFTAPPSGESFIYMKTDDNPMGQPMPWGKFCVWVPMQRTPYPLGVTLVHSACRLFIFKYYLMVAWTTYLDVCGVPARILFPGRTLEGDDKTAAENAMKNISSDFWGILNGMDDKARLETLTPGSGGTFFEEGARFCNDSFSQLFLMQTLTSDVRDSGSRALGQVHQSVRSDLLASDLMNESDNIENNIIKPMLMLRYPGREMPLPWFRRKMKEAKDVEADRLVLDQITKAESLGLPMETSWLYESLGIPKPDGVEVPDVVFPRKQEPQKPETAPDDSQDDDEDEPQPASIRDEVLAAIDRRWMNIKELMRSLNRTEPQIRGVVTAHDMRSTIERRKIGSDATQYRLRKKSR